MNRVLLFMTQWLRVWVIDTNGSPYLERYRVGKLFGWTVYLHHYVTCDGEPWLHDHPWPRAVSIILAGGYTEERLAYFCPAVGLVTSLKPVKRFNYLTARDFHRIDSIKPYTWTLFMVAPNCKG